MSYFGKHWLIDGVAAGPIHRSYPANGRYTVIFEREYASLEQIETINWAKPTIEHIWPHGNEAGLPEGYGFDVIKIDYQSSDRSYRVELKTAIQYLGDVAGYQDQVDELKGVVAQQAVTINEQSNILAAQQAFIEDQAATIQTLEEAGSVSELEGELEAAYQEGVDSVG